MRRVLLVAAAGRGSRLKADRPKLLVDVGGRTMIDRALSRYRDACVAAVLVVDPTTRALVAARLPAGPRVTLSLQERQTGMLDALLAGRDAVLAHAPDRVWITWCDQVAISHATVIRLEALDASPDRPDLAMPLVEQSPPYVHFERDREGRLTGVRQRREGDPMPDTGVSDAGLFSLSRRAYEQWLPEYAATARAGALTGERNFLPFVPWLATRGSIETFEAPAVEARGVNTPEDLAAVEAHLRGVDPSWP